MEFSIVIPSHNEAENLPSILEDIRKELDKTNIQYEIIVVDDNSSDDTEITLKSLKNEIPALKILKTEQHIGYGNAILKGLSNAPGKILGIIDADGQIKAKCLIEAYKKLKKENLDFCKGVRTTRYDGWSRKLISRGYNLLFKIMFGGDLEDINAKPKIFTCELYKDIKPLSKDWFIDAEILLKAQKKRYKIGEIPVIYYKRRKGLSKIRAFAIFESLKNLIYWRFFAKF